SCFAGNGAFFSLQWSDCFLFLTVLVPLRFWFAFFGLLAVVFGSFLSVLSGLGFALLFLLFSGLFSSVFCCFRVWFFGVFALSKTVQMQAERAFPHFFGVNNSIFFPCIFSSYLYPKMLFYYEEFTHY